MSFVDIVLGDQWYEKKAGDDCHEELKRTVDQLQSNSLVRRDLCRFWLSLFYDRGFAGFGGIPSPQAYLEDFRNRLNENVIQQATQQLSSKFARQRSKPCVLTDGADFGLQRRAKNADRYLWGQMRATHYFDRQQMSDVHSIICGDGFLQFGRKGKRIVCDYAPPWEIKVEQSDALYGNPRRMYRERFMPIRTLMKMFPGKKAELATTPAAPLDETIGLFGEARTDLVSVWYCWHLATDEDEPDDGRFALCTANATLVNRVFEAKRFPLSRFAFNLAPEGYFGIGGVPGMVGMQLEHNRTLASRQDALELLSAPFVLLERGSEIVKNHLVNAIGKIIEYTGTKPEIVTPSTINPESFTHSDRVKQSMFNQIGISQDAAMSVIPAGLRSGKAIRAYGDAEDARFLAQYQRRAEQTALSGEIILDIAEEIEKEESGHTVLYVGPLGTESISFTEARFGDSPAIVQVEPASSLSTTLGGKLEDISDMKDLGIIENKQQMLRLLQMPDLISAEEELNAMPNALRFLISELIMGRGEFHQPSPRWDLQMAIDICEECRLIALTRKNVPAGRLDLLSRFEDNCVYWLTKGQEGVAPDNLPGSNGAATAEQQPPTNTADVAMQGAPELGAGQPPMPTGSAPPMALG